MAVGASAHAMPAEFRGGGAFEAHLIAFNPDIYGRFLAPMENKEGGVHTYNFAVYDVDTIVEATHSRYVSKKYTMSSYPDGAASVGGSKFSAQGKESKFTVQARDFSRFLDELDVDQDGLVVLKIDIEGSEYRVMRRLIISGVLCRLMDVLFVEFHGGWFDNSLKEHDRRKDVASMRWMLSAPGCLQLLLWERGMILIDETARVVEGPQLVQGHLHQSSSYALRIYNAL